MGKILTSDLAGVLEASCMEELKFTILPVYIFSVLKASQRREKKEQIKKIATKAAETLTQKNLSVPGELKQISQGDFWGHMFFLGRIKINEQERSS
ncbi:MAG: hypothetical protein JW812_02090 [Alphaproteobacteria bacterium]|nr:hypothetical protein [Alphaproteobacteria bacterium]MBN2779537.1 hypothetical protein [Alphaproteobacteria bacterium]